MQMIIQESQSPLNRKLLTSIVLAAFITFSLFVVMQKLIEQDQVFVTEPVTTPPFTFVLEETDETTITKAALPEKPEAQKQPRTVMPNEPLTPDNVNMSNSFTVSVPKIEIENAGTDLTIEAGDARPLVRMQPKYPIEAARNGIEGWVELRFTIDASGQVKDVQVIDSQPKRVFDQEARRALLKWKYKPQIVDGDPVDQPGMQIVLDFKLNS